MLEYPLSIKEGLKECEGQIVIKIANETTGKETNTRGKLKKLLILCYTVFRTEMRCFLHNILVCYKQLRN